MESDGSPEDSRQLAVVLVKAGNVVVGEIVHRGTIVVIVPHLQKNRRVIAEYKGVAVEDESSRVLFALRPSTYCVPEEQFS